VPGAQPTSGNQPASKTNSISRMSGNDE
jgi:hypothetical protein